MESGAASTYARRGQIIYPSIDGNCMGPGPRICKSGTAAPCKGMQVSDSEIRRTAATFARPSQRAGMVQLATSFGPFLAACVAMYLVYPLSPWLTLALALPTGALLVRVFIIQHDCGHGSFFASRRANVAVGRLCSLITLTPFANWSRQHGRHHGDWNNLDRSGGGADIYSACLTVQRVSRAVALAAPALPPAAPSAGRQPAAAAAGVPAALPRAVRHAARLATGALLGLFHQPRAARDVRHAWSRCSAGRRSCSSMCR